MRVRDNERYNRILVATIITLTITFVAKGIGFLRSIIEASVLGASRDTDTYNVINALFCNIIYILTNSVGIAFVPQYMAKKAEMESKEFVAAVLKIVFVFSSILLLISQLFPHIISHILFYGCSIEQFSTASRWIRIMSIAIPFLSVINIYQQLLNAEKIYGYVSINAIVNSVVFIFSLIIFGRKYGVEAMVFAMPLSAAIQFFIVIIRGKSFVGLKNKKVEYCKYATFFIAIIPVVFSDALGEIGIIVDKILLASLSDGVVTSVTYATIIYSMLVDIIVLSIVPIGYTELSEAAMNNDNNRLCNIKNQLIKNILLICLPIIIVVYIESIDIINIIFGHGKYDYEYVLLSSEAMRWYILCVIPICLKNVLFKMFYALNKMRIPALLGGGEVILNIALSVYLVKKYDMVGVLMGTLFSTIVFTVILIIISNVILVDDYKKTLWIEYGKIVLSAVIAMALGIKISYLHQEYMVCNIIFVTIGVCTIYAASLFILREKTIGKMIKKILIRLK